MKLFPDYVMQKMWANFLVGNGSNVSAIMSRLDVKNMAYQVSGRERERVSGRERDEFQIPNTQQTETKIPLKRFKLFNENEQQQNFFPTELCCCCCANERDIRSDRVKDHHQKVKLFILHLLNIKLLFISPTKCVNEHTQLN